MNGFSLILTAASGGAGLGVALAQSGGGSGGGGGGSTIFISSGQTTDSDIAIYIFFAACVCIYMIFDMTDCCGTADYHDRYTRRWMMDEEVTEVDRRIGKLEKYVKDEEGDDDRVHPRELPPGDFRGHFFGFDYINRGSTKCSLRLFREVPTCIPRDRGMQTIAGMSQDESAGRLVKMHGSYNHRSGRFWFVRRPERDSNVFYTGYAIHVNEKVYLFGTWHLRDVRSRMQWGNFYFASQAPGDAAEEGVDMEEVSRFALMHGLDKQFAQVKQAQDALEDTQDTPETV